MSKIAVIGPDKLFGGFSAFGIDVFNTMDPAEAREVLIKLKNEKKHSIIYILEQFTADIQDVIDQISKQSSPSLVILPGVGDGSGYGVNRIRGLVQRASGQNLF